jgi:hypothetical protein
MNSEDIEQSAKNIRIDRAAIDHARILADAEAALEKSRKPVSAEIQPPIWRTIMKAKVSKLAAAAVVAIAVIVGTHFLTGSGASLALADIRAATQTIDWVRTTTEGTKLEGWYAFESKIIIEKQEDGAIAFVDFGQNRQFHYDPHAETLTISEIVSDEVIGAKFEGPFFERYDSAFAFLAEAAELIQAEGGKFRQSRGEYEGAKVLIWELSHKAPGYFSLDAEGNIVEVPREEYGDETIRVFIDAEQHLPLAIQTKWVKKGELIHEKRTNFQYPDKGPKDIYDLGLPESVRIMGTSVVLAEVVQNVEQVKSAIMREKRIFTCDGKEISFLNSDAVRYYSSEYGAREDMYNTEGLLLHQVYWLTQENVRIKVVPPMEQYERTELTEAERTVWGQPGLRDIVELLKASKPVPLGRREINGRETEGFQITDTGLEALIPIQVDSGVARFWVDVETSLPIQYEAELLTSDKLLTSMTDGKPIQIAVTGHDPQWNVEIEPSIFEPNIPRNYTTIVVEQSGPLVDFISLPLPPNVQIPIVEIPHDDAPGFSWLPDISWLKGEDLEYIHKSRDGVSIVLRKQFAVDIAAFQLQCNWDDLEDFYEKLDISFTGTSSPGSYAILSPEVARHVFELADSSDVFVLRTRSFLTAGNGHKCLFGISSLGSAVLGPVQKYKEQHIDLSFSFFPHAWLESFPFPHGLSPEGYEHPDVTRASVDIPGIKVGPREAVLVRYANPARVISKDGGNVENDSMESIVMLLVQIAEAEKSL